MLNEDIAYLLGMIVGKGTIKRGNKETQIVINIPHKNLEIEGQDTQTSIKASLLDIKERLEGLIETRLTADTINSNVAHLSFTKPNDSYLIRTINEYLKNYFSWKDFRIPKDIFDSSEMIIVEFLRGLSDVTAHIRKSNIAFLKKNEETYNIRVYIEIPSNLMLVVDIANLLKNLDIPVHTINWAHPNFRDPQLKDYKEGKKPNFREHQIKIFADEFEKIGFNISHKNKLLEKYAKLNRKIWDKKWLNASKKAKSTKAKDNALSKIGNLKNAHHKFYWEIKSRASTKLNHPLENSPLLDIKIRGKHFDNWRELARELGYHE